MRRAALAAALAAAAFLPGEPLGIAVWLVAALVALAAATAVRPRPDAFVLGALALALAAVPAIRDAGWVAALALAGAWLVGSVAAAGPSLAATVAPFLRLRDASGEIPSAPSGTGPVVRGGVLAGVVAAPFLALFWSADAAFADLVARVPVPSVESLAGRALAFALVFLAAAGLAHAARRPVAGRIPRPRRRLSPWEWGIPLALLDALFAAFVVVQLAVLFGGHDHVLRTAGLTYAEYAREGFWQLLAAAALTLAFVGAAALVAETRTRSHRLLLRALLGLLCALTIVVCLSALRRLLLYEDAFGLTRIRLLAEAFALWLGAVFAVVVAAGTFARVRPWLPRAGLAGTAAALLVFSLANPDGRIASRNVELWRDTGGIDLAYLQTLSADAVPAVTELPPALRRAALARLADRLARDEPWSSANLSRERARDLLAREQAHPRHPARATRSSSSTSVPPWSL